jgi:hypothetical protein
VAPVAAGRVALVDVGAVVAVAVAVAAGAPGKAHTGDRPGALVDN